jgi:hypothetical protein
MIRQRSHIGFTDARTFTKISCGRLAALPVAAETLCVSAQHMSGRIQSVSEKARRPQESGPQAQKTGLAADREW